MNTQKGFSLLELLIVLTISSTFLLAMYQLFFQQQQQYHHQQTTIEAQENTRLALHLLKSPLQAAGEAGCQSVPLALNNHVHYSPIDLKILQGYALYGFHGHEQGWTPPLPQQLAHKVIPQTDAIIIEKASYARTNLAQPMTSPHDPIHITQKKLFKAGEIALIANCTQADLFIVNEVYESNKGQLIYPNQITHTYTTDAQVMHWQVDAYYLSQHSQDKTKTALHQKTLLPDSPAIELVLDIEALNIEYALLSQETPVFLKADEITQWEQVQGLSLQVQAKNQMPNQLNVPLYN